MFYALVTFIIFIISHSVAMASPAVANSISTIDTDFCLVNSTASTLVISEVSVNDSDDWTGDFLPGGLLNQRVLPNAASCWPLTLVRRLASDDQFNMVIATDTGQVAWVVKQSEATGEIHHIYATSWNETTDYLLQKAGDDNGYATNVFILEESVKLQNDYLSNWMGQIPDDATLNKIELIGTHDAGINLQDGVSCDAPSALAVAQAWSLPSQLSHGVRYFDIRLEKGNDEKHYPYHRILSLGCTSKKSFEQSLSEMIDFIKQHRSETVLIKISHTSSPVDSVIKMLDSFTHSEETGRYFYKSNHDTGRWTDKSMGELRGKIVLLLDCEYVAYLNPQNGYFSFSTMTTGRCSPDASTQVIYDKYSNTKDFNNMYFDQLDKLKQHGNDTNQLFLLSWTLTGGKIIAHTPRPAAYLAGLSRDQFGKLLPLPNIVYYDFEDPGVNKILIANAESTKGFL